jgi:alpha-beta hydrolase superfamily lysophospholipase
MEDPMNAIREQVRVHEEWLPGAGGMKIFVRSWEPVQAPRAIVAIVPGFKSYSAHYHWAGEQLASQGFAVHAVDLRGRGKSDGERFWVDRIEDYLSDVRLLVDTARGRNPGLPVFLLGHSAGGVLASVFTLDHQDELAGLICESFAYQVFAPPGALSIVRGLGSIAPHLHVLKLPNKHFSRDPQVVAAMDRDPLLANEVQPTHTVAEMLGGADRLTREFGDIRLPVLILHGTADKVTRPAGSQFFFDHAGSQDKQLKLYDGHAHDLLNDLDKQQVLADIRAWMLARL